MLLSGLQSLSAHVDFYTSIGKTSRRQMRSSWIYWLFPLTTATPFKRSVHVESCSRLVVMVNFSMSDLFHPGQMTDLLYTEKDLVTSLKDYIKAEESKLERVKQ